MAQVVWRVLDEEKLSLSSARVFVKDSMRSFRKHCLRKHASGQERQSYSQLETLHEKLAVEDETLRKKMSAHFRLLRVEGMVPILPCQFQAPERACELFLSRFQHKLLPELGGIWLAHGKCHILDAGGFTSEAERTGCVSLGVQVQVLVFRPFVKHPLVGIVTAVRETHVAVLVLGLYNARIAADKMTGFKFNARKNRFDSERGSLKEGTEFCFHVLKYEYAAAGHVSVIQGALKDTDRVTK